MKKQKKRNLHGHSYKKNKLEQFKGFCMTVECNGSITEAATKMHTSPSTISLQIASLEQDLDLQLFDRINNKLVLNEIGKKYYNKIKKCLDEFNFIFQKEEERRHLNIAAHYAIIKNYMPKLIKKFLEIDKKMTFDITHCSKEEGLSGVLNNKYDFAIFPFEANDLNFSPEISAHKILNYKPALIVAKDHPLARIKESDLNVEDIIKNYNYLYLEDTYTSKTQKETIEMLNVKSNIKFYHCNWDILEKFVEEKLGVTGFDVLQNNQENLNNVILNKSFLMFGIDYYLLYKKHLSIIKYRDIIELFFTASAEVN